MTADRNSPEARYERLVATCCKRFGIARPTGKGFGAAALRADGKIFAMLTRGQLVVKLPQARVDALVASGDGERFDANRGKKMKEWLALASQDDAEWLALAEEALRFVGAPTRPAKPPARRPGSAKRAVRRSS